MCNVTHKYCNLLSVSIQAICQRQSAFFLFSSQSCFHTCFCIRGHQTCGSSGLWVPVRCSVSQGAQSSVKMLCFQLDGLLRRARDPERMIPTVAYQRLTSAWRVAFRGRFHGSLISPLETGWLIGWKSSFYLRLTVGRRQLHSLLLWSHREPPGGLDKGSLVSSFGVLMSTSLFPVYQAKSSHAAYLFLQNLFLIVSLSFKQDSTGNLSRETHWSTTPQLQSLFNLTTCRQDQSSLNWCFVFI